MDHSNTLTLHIPDEVYSKLYSVKIQTRLVIGSSYQDLCLCCGFGIEDVTITAAGGLIIKQYFNLCFPAIHNKQYSYLMYDG